MINRDSSMNYNHDNACRQQTKSNTTINPEPEEQSKNLNAMCRVVRIGMADLTTIHRLIDRPTSIQHIAMEVTLNVPFSCPRPGWALGDILLHQNHCLASSAYRTGNSFTSLALVKHMLCRCKLCGPCGVYGTASLRLRLYCNWDA